MNDSSRLLRITCLLLCVGLGSCASWRGDDAPEPQVHLVKVQVVRARLLEQKFMLHFRVDNPRTHDLTVRGLSYRVHLGDQLLAKGEHEHWFTVRPGQSGYFEVPIRTNLWPQLRGLVKCSNDPATECLIAWKVNWKPVYSSPTTCTWSAMA